MESVADPVAGDIDQFLQSRDRQSLLRFVTCGGVDDGKSTLIGRLLYESRLLYENQLAALQTDSVKVGTLEGALDFALPADSPTAEREQGIIIDMAYRHFATDKRRFIAADTPGHERCTRELVAGASTADLAVILIDARKGALTQTRRHSYLVSILGVRHVVLAVNKMDLVGYSQAVFDPIEQHYRAYAQQIGLRNLTCIPVAALTGDNIAAASENTPWYRGPSLLHHLENVDITVEGGPFRMPVQLVNQPNPDFRGYSGRVVGGNVRRGDLLKALPSGKESTVERIVTLDGDLDLAVAGQSITLTFDDEIAISRGDMLAAADSPPGVADQFQADIIWMGEEPMLPGRSYLLKTAAKTVGATLGRPKYKVNVNSLEHLSAGTLNLNDIGVCNLTLDQEIAFDSYAQNRDTGGFILIDRISNNTIGAGMLHYALRRSQNIHRQAVEIDKQAHAALKMQQPAVVWFTGLSGAGKSSIANLLEKQLHAMGRHTCLLDGDNVRHGLCRDLGFTQADRVENIRRVAEVARLMVDAGLIVLVAFISPFRSEREMARAMVQKTEFCEVFVDTPLSVAEQRDPKGLYGKARRGELKNFTGIDSPYEPPQHPDVRIDTTVQTIEDAAERIIAHLRCMGTLG